MIDNPCSDRALCRLEGLLWGFLVDSEGGRQVEILLKFIFHSCSIFIERGFEGKEPTLNSSPSDGTRE